MDCEAPYNHYPHVGEPYECDAADGALVCHQHGQQTCIPLLLIELVADTYSRLSESPTPVTTDARNPRLSDDETFSHCCLLSGPPETWQNHGDQGRAV